MPKNTTEEKKKFSFKKVIPWFKEKKIRWIAAILLILAAGFFIFNNIRNRSNASDAYQTVVVERGDFIAIVGATGVVEAKQTTESTGKQPGELSMFLRGG